MFENDWLMKGANIVQVFVACRVWFRLVERTGLKK